MKVLHLNYALGDGAGNAVERLHSALVQRRIESRLMYLRPHASSDSPLSMFEKKLNGLENRLVIPFTGGNLVDGYPSLNVFSSKVLKVVNHSDADVVHLHWINGEMLSIAQVARITKPVVWTFHSMWPFLGMYHWDAEGDVPRNWKSETVSLKTTIPSSLHYAVDKWTLARKKKHWKNLKCRVVCPSRWMSACAERSELFRGYPVRVIPNCLDLEVFRPMGDQTSLRTTFGLPADKRILLFGATAPGAARKGGDLITPLLHNLQDSGQVALAVFGTKEQRTVPASETAYGLDTYEIGFIREPETMALLYNAVDVVCVPSRQDNLPSVCLEAQACGRAVVAFNVGGLPDMVIHRESGYLAREQDIGDFREGLAWAFAQRELDRNAIRSRIASGFSMDRVARMHVDEYKRVLDND